MARGIPKASAQSTVLWSIGDLTCQKLEKRTSIDTRRLASNAAYGAVVLGPVGHLWYEGALVVFCEGSSHRGAAMVAAKLAFDLCVFGPAHLACFLGWSGSGPSPGRLPDDDAARGGGGGRKPSPSKGRAEKRGEKTRGEEAKGTLKAGDAKGPAGPYAPPSAAPEPPSGRISSRARRRHRVLGPGRRRTSRLSPCQSR